MRSRSTATAAVLCCLAAATRLGPALAADPPLWDGLFADGTRITGMPIAGWHAPASQPQLGGKPMFDAANPVRWVVRTTARPTAGEPTQPFVELACGDRLPGIVEEHESGVENWRRVTPPHLLVRPLTAIDLPNRQPRGHVRVASEQVRRVVFVPRPGPPLAPAIILLRDGREIGFRSLRFSGRGLIILGNDSTLRLAFHEIAEIRMPEPDPWDDYTGLLAWLVPQAATAAADVSSARLTRAETDDGLVVTTAVEPLRGAGDPNNPSTWHLLAQPAWSLDPLWIPHAAVRRRLVFAAHEVPLSLIAPAAVVQKGTFGSSWTWHCDRNVQGGPLAAGRLPFGHGFGVQARCELTFPLPPFATAFRTGAALDDLAAGGGCARASVHEGTAAAKPLWQSDFLIGTREPLDTGTLPLASGSAGPRTIVLVADTAHEGRPDAADPYDIRDIVDWLDPVVSLAAEGLATTVRERLSATMPAWRDWEVAGDPAIRTSIDPLAPAETPLPLRQSLAAGRETLLRRRLEVSADMPHLVVAVTRTAASASRFEIRIDGKPVAAADVPERKAGGAVPPFVFPLARFVGRSIDVEVAHTGSDDTSFVEWWALGPAGPLGTRWHTLAPTTLASESQATFRSLDDGSVRLGGPSADKDVHTLGIDTDLEKITGLRLEAIRDDSLPAGSPCRSATGNFVLQSFTAEATSRVDPARTALLAFAKATATFAQPNYAPEMMIDTNPASGWAIGGVPEDVAPAVILTLASPAGFEGGTRLAVVMRYGHGGQHVLGRFRLSATTDADPQFGIPATMLEDAGLEDAAPTDESATGATR